MKKNKENTYKKNGSNAYDIFRRNNDHLERICPIQYMYKSISNGENVSANCLYEFVSFSVSKHKSGMIWTHCRYDGFTDQNSVADCANVCVCVEAIKCA